MEKVKISEPLNQSEAALSTPRSQGSAVKRGEVVYTLDRSPIYRRANHLKMIYCFPFKDGTHILHFVF